MLLIWYHFFKKNPKTPQRVDWKLFFQINKNPSYCEVFKLLHFTQHQLMAADECQLIGINYNITLEDTRLQTHTKIMIVDNEGLTTSIMKNECK